jgi:hypothetical protein
MIAIIGAKVIDPDCVTFTGFQAARIDCCGMPVAVDVRRRQVETAVGKDPTLRETDIALVFVTLLGHSVSCVNNHG